MKNITQEEKDMRIELLKEVASLTINFTTNQTRIDFGDEQAEQISACLSVNDLRISAAVDYYYDYLLYAYKKHNGYFDEERNSGRDKMAAFTAISLMTFVPIDILPYAGQATAVAEIRENFALLFASTVLHVDCGIPRSPEQAGDAKARSPDVPVIVVRNMLLNLRDLGILARRRAADNNLIQSTEPLADWVIQSMQLYALAFGKIDLRF